ncbi:hypothetical protein TNCV_4641251 [Trichonephila clavipes]|nr:hypothetical protein TNCV_4641251 [Trichonephila clavipes]
MRISHKRLDHLEDNIRRVIADRRPQMLEKVIENWTSRLDYIRASCGSHTPEIIFKIGRGCLVVKVTDSWQVCHEFDPGITKGQLCRGNLSMLTMSGLKCPPIGVVLKLREGGFSELSSPSFDHGSELRGSSPKAL